MAKLMYITLFFIGGCLGEKIRCDPEKVTAEVGKSVTFHCKIQSGVRVSFVEWRFNGSKEESQDVHAWRNEVDDLEGQDPAFKGRTKFFPEKMKTGNFSLQISNVTKEDEGKYSVTVNAETKSMVTLSVENPQDQDKEHGEHGTNAGPIVGVSVVLIVGVIVGVIYVYRKKIAEKEEPQNMVL